MDDASNLNIQLKEAGLAAEVRKTVADVGHDITISSFLLGALAEVNELEWSVPTGLLFESDPDDNLRRALELDCAVVHPHYELCLSSDIVEAAHDAGLGSSRGKQHGSVKKCRHSNQPVWMV